MSDSKHHDRMTVEDLLHLKRSERPSPEFWTRFETELRQKQLAALIDRRPWWQLLPQLLADRRSLVPIGATAVLALTFVSIKFHAVDPVARDAAIVSTVATAALVQTAPVVVASVSPAISESRELISTSQPIQDSLVYSGIVTPPPLSSDLPERASELTPWSAPRSVQIPTARLFAANSEHVQKEDPRLVRTLSSNSTSAEADRVQRSTGAVAELASVSALASRRTRLLAQFGDRQFTPEPQAPALVRERLSRRLADAGSNDHFARVGLKGDQVSLRF